MEFQVINPLNGEKVTFQSTRDAGRFIKECEEKMAALKEQQEHNKLAFGSLGELYYKVSHNEKIILENVSREPEVQQEFSGFLPNATNIVTVKVQNEENLLAIRCVDGQDSFWLAVGKLEKERAGKTKTITGTMVIPNDLALSLERLYQQAFNPQGQQRVEVREQNHQVGERSQQAA